MSARLASSGDIADLLLRINCVQFDFASGFQYASGIVSPIYCDCRRVVSHPHERDLVVNALAELACDSESTEKPQAVAGVASAGIPYGSIVAHLRALPFVYARPKAKAHGMQQTIEGVLHPNDRVVIVEDTISTGRSALQTAQVIRAAGAVPQACVSIMNYCFSSTEAAFARESIPVRSLTTFAELLKAGVRNGQISENNLKSLWDWWHTTQAAQSANSGSPQ